MEQQRKSRRKSKMRRITIIIVLLLILIGGAISAPILIRYNFIRYENEMTEHVGAYMAGGSVTGRYKGVGTSLCAANVNDISNALTRYERNFRLFKPKYNEDEAVVINFSDGAEYIVVDGGMSGVKDVAYVIYSFEGRTFYLSIIGYETFSRVTQCVSPEGFMYPNEEINWEEHQI